MFGMSNKKEDESGKEAEFFFDIEEEVRKDPKKAKEMQEHALSMLREIKKVIDKGVSKEELPEYQRIIEGYMNYAKVCAAMSVKLKK